MCVCVCVCVRVCFMKNVTPPHPPPPPRLPYCLFPMCLMLYTPHKQREGRTRKAPKVEMNSLRKTRKSSLTDDVTIGSDTA